MRRKTIPIIHRQAFIVQSRCLNSAVVQCGTDASLQMKNKEQRICTLLTSLLEQMMNKFGAQMRKGHPSDMTRPTPSHPGYGRQDTGHGERLPDFLSLFFRCGIKLMSNFLNGHCGFF